MLCDSLMAFLSSLSSPFLPSACHENTSTDVNHIPGKYYLQQTEGLLFAELVVGSYKGQKPHLASWERSAQISILDFTRSGLQSL